MRNTRGFIAEDRPDLVEEWHTNANEGNTPDNIRVGSDKFITWCCKECGHIWENQAKSRAIKNTGCPKCHERYNVGFPELAIYYYIKQIFKDAQLNVDIEGLGKYKSVDVFIKSVNLIIEYDGGYTHREKFEMDCEKSGLIIDNGLDPLSIGGVWEYLYERRDSDKTVGEMIKQVLLIIDKHYKGFTKDIKKVIEVIDVGVDTIPILAQIPPVIEKDNLLENFPEVEQLWDYDRNYPLRPEILRSIPISKYGLLVNRNILL